MSVAPKTKLTAAEYLAIENAAEFKSEFYDGVMYPLHRGDDGVTLMAGATPGHNRIKENLIVQLGMRFLNGPCQTFSSDQRVRLTDTGMYAYPDIVIVCDPPAFDRDDPNTLTNPQVVIEVLSPSTERYYRGYKFAQYRQQRSLREVVLVSQDVVLVERYVRQPDGTWALADFADPGGEFALATAPARVPLADVYRGVEFPNPPPRPVG
jgi:Uma2 family endonuclease